MSKQDNFKNDDILSFEDLKKKVDGVSVNEHQTDAFADLLSEISDTPKQEEQPHAEPIEIEAENVNCDTPTENIKAESEDEGFTLQMDNDIFEDIMNAVENPNEMPEATSRRSKYAKEEQSYISVANIYQKQREEEPQPLESVVVRSEKKTTTKEPISPAVEKENPIEEIVPENQTGEKAKKGKKKKAKKVQKSDEQIRTFNEIFKGWAMAFFPNKHDRASEIVRKIVMDVSVFTLIGCGIWFGVLMGQKSEAKNQLTDIKQQIIQSDDTQSEDEAWAEFFARYPDMQLPEGMMPKYAYLYAINPHLVGWIRIPNTIIDVQVVQAADNQEYLKKDFYGGASRYGCPFMDYRNDPKYLAQNTIIYGHHMSDGLVFADLDKYKTSEGFKESPIIEFDTLYRTYKYKIYAAFVTNSIAEQDNDYIFNYTITRFKTQEKFDGYMRAVDERKLYTTGVDINYSDKLITLSTCSYEYPEARLVIIGRMLRDGENESVDLEAVTENENPRRPQIWYDKRHIENPFADAEKWYINGDPATSVPETTEVEGTTAAPAAE